MNSQIGFVISMLFIMVTLGISYQVSKETEWYQKSTTLAFKGLTTFTAALLALYAYAVTGNAFSLVMAIGLLLCAFADVLLELQFLVGTTCFALGHIAYIVSFLMRRAPTIINLVIYFIMSFISFLVLKYAYQKIGKQILPYFAYSLIIGAMVALSFGQPWLATLGAVLFAVSDAIIARRIINENASALDRTCIFLYYSGQFLLAISLLVQ